jgi:hypothetical protein
VTSVTTQLSTELNMRPVPTRSTWWRLHSQNAGQAFDDTGAPSAAARGQSELEREALDILRKDGTTEAST